MDIVLVPGAWAGGWLWNEVAELLRSKGHNTHQITLSGLDVYTSNALIGLNSHVRDLESYIVEHNLRHVVLVGHSYSGIVVGQVATQSNLSIAHTIFVEAFLPVSGKSLLEVSGLSIEEEKDAIEKNHGLWPVPSADELEIQPELSRSQKKLLFQS